MTPTALRTAAHPPLRRSPPQGLRLRRFKRPLTLTAVVAGAAGPLVRTTALRKSTHR